MQVSTYEIRFETWLRSPVTLSSFAAYSVVGTHTHLRKKKTPIDIRNVSSFAVFSISCVDEMLKI